MAIRFELTPWGGGWVELPIFCKKFPPPWTLANMPPPWLPWPNIPPPWLLCPKPFPCPWFAWNVLFWLFCWLKSEFCEFELFPCPNKFPGELLLCWNALLVLPWLLKRFPLEELLWPNMLLEQKVLPWVFWVGLLNKFPPWSPPTEVKDLWVCWPPPKDIAFGLKPPAFWPWLLSLARNLLAAPKPVEGTPTPWVMGWTEGIIGWTAGAVEGCWARGGNKDGEGFEVSFVVFFSCYFLVDSIICFCISASVVPGLEFLLLLKRFNVVAMGYAFFGIVSIVFYSFFSYLPEETVMDPFPLAFSAFFSSV